MTWLQHRVREFAGDLVRAVTSSGPINRYLNQKSISRDELEELADEQGRLWRFGTTEQICLHEPRFVGNVPSEIAREIGRNLRIEPPFVCELREVELIGPRAITVANDGRYLLENSLGYPDVLAQHLLLTLASGTIPTRRRNKGESDLDVAVSLVGPWTNGYFHWFSDWLPRLRGVNHYVSETGVEPTIIVPGNLTAWMEESLRLVGYGDWIEWTNDRVQVDRLIVPTAPHDAGASDSAQGHVHSPVAYNWIRNRVLENIAFDAISDYECENILISRRDAPTRRIVNEDAVYSALADRGFERYVLSELSFAEQVTLFASANAVVAPHGAGLTNMLYGDNLGVVELFGDYVNPCYFTMAQLLDFTYGCLQCDPVGDDLEVDVDELLRLLDSVAV